MNTAVATKEVAAHITHAGLTNDAILRVAITRCFDSQRAFATEIADAVIKMASPLGTLRTATNQYGHIERVCKEIIEESRYLASDANHARQAANNFMAAHGASSMWTAPDLKIAHPALWQEHIDINKKLAASSERLESAGEMKVVYRAAAYREIGKACALEAAGAAPLGLRVGEMYIVSYLAGGIVREKLMKEDGIRMGDKMLGVFMQYAAASAGGSGVDFYENNAMSEAVGRALGLRTSKQARDALYGAISQHVVDVVAQTVPTNSAINRKAPTLR